MTTEEMEQEQDRVLREQFKPLPADIGSFAKDGSLDPEPRYALKQFAAVMEAKLRKNDHKTGWHELPIEALFRLLLIELEEFKVAKEFLSVAEARNELVDVANYAMILWDRLSTEDQKAKVGK